MGIWLLIQQGRPTRCQANFLGDPLLVAGRVKALGDGPRWRHHSL